jgi:hypothetical protein
MAYIGQGLDRFSNVEKLDIITPSTSTGAGPYNLTQNSTAFTPINANSLVISIDGVIQYGNFSVNNATVTFDAALSDANTCDFIYQMGIGLISTPADDTVTTAKLSDNSVTSAKIVNDTIVNADINSSAAIATTKLASNSITINGSAVALGGSVTVGETKPTIGSISPTVITNAATAVTITGTNFISVPQVEAISSTGAITAADSITYTSATQVVATFTLPTDGTYFLRVENNDGNAARSGSALLNVSDEPAWVTSAGSLGSFAGGSAIATQTLTCTDAVSFTVSPSPIATGLTFATGVGSCTITGTQTQHTSATTSNFTVTATDAEGQTSPRAFSMSWTFGASGGGQFN